MCVREHLWDHTGVNKGECASCVHTRVFLIVCFFFQQYLKPPKQKEIGVLARNKCYFSCAHMFSLCIINAKFTCAVTMSQSVIFPPIIPPSCWAEFRHVVADQKTDCISFLAKSGAFPGTSWSPEERECMTGEHHKRFKRFILWEIPPWVLWIMPLTLHIHLFLRH